MGHYIVDEGEQPGGGAAASELARQQGAGGGPALVLLEPGFGGRREGVDKGDQAGCLVNARRRSRSRARSPTARQTRWALVLPRARSSAGINRRPSQGLCCSGAICSQASSARAAATTGGRAAVFRDGGPPVGQAVLLVPVEIVDQRIAGFLAAGVATADLCIAADGGLDRGKGVSGNSSGSPSAKKTLPEMPSPAPRFGVLGQHFRRAGPAQCPGRPPPPLPSRANWRGHRRQREAGVGAGDGAAGAEHGLRPDEWAGRGVDVPMRVAAPEVFERNQVAVEPQAGAAVGKMGPGTPAGLDRAAAQPFIEAGEAILGGGERSRQSGPGERVGERCSRLA